MRRIRFKAFGFIGIVLAVSLYGNTSAQTTRRPALKKGTTATRAVTTPALFRVNAGKKIRVRMNDTTRSVRKHHASAIILRSLLPSRYIRRLAPSLFLREAN